MISFKSFDNNLISSDKEMMEFIFNKQDIFLEHTFYHRDKAIAIKNSILFKDIPATFHFNSDFVNLDNFKEKEFLIELEIVRFFNAKKLILHPEQKDTTQKVHYQEKLIPQLITNLEKMQSHLIDEKIFIENVHFDIEFYKIFFKQAKNIGFCFDIGHAKVFSKYSFNEWFEFLKELDEDNIEIYFHIHANNGTKDEHKPYHDYPIEELNDDFFSKDMLSDVKKLLKTFDKSWISLELMPNKIIKEIIFLEKLIS